MPDKPGPLNAVDFDFGVAVESGPEAEGCAFIGEGVTFTGSITVPGKIIVHGTIEGGDTQARELHVGRTGVVSGKTCVDVAEVHGRVVERIEARVRLSVRKTGSIEGTAVYGEIEVEKGGKLSGNVSTLSTSEENPEPAIKLQTSRQMVRAAG